MTMTKEEASTVATQTVKYLGGSGRLSAMIGAKNFSSDKEGTLSFKFSMFKKANYVSFKVNGKDLYDVTFSKLSKYELKEVKVFNDLYFDQLKKIFEEYTGLYLTL
jgi:hypothetical protein